MNSGDSDKTIFRPSANADSTILRPTPGGGRRGGHGAPAPTAPVAERPVAESYGSPAGFAPQAAAIEPLQGLNPLVSAASVLLTLIEKTRHSLSHPNVEGLYQRLVSEIRAFENRARASGIKNEIVVAARYLLCTALDEAVLNTPWGGESRWPQQTLLSTFHNETAGGEKFFLILDRLRASPREHLHILELIYLCLSLGFEGKYKLSHRGRDALEQIRDELFGVIRSGRGDYERTLSPHGRGLGRIHTTLANHIPLWVIAVVFMALLLLIFFGFNYGMHSASAPGIERLLEIGKP